LIDRILTRRTLIRTRHLLDIAAFARESLAFEPDPLQVRALNPLIRRGLLNCCRQWGKSTTVAVRAVHHALAQPKSLTVVVAPSSRQSGELVRKAGEFFHLLDIKTRGDGANEVSLLLPNGSRIVGLPGKQSTIRGFSKVGLLLVDEASRVPDDLYHSVRPMIAAHRDAAIWLLSTPNGRQGFFFREWTAGGPHWNRIEAPATECARIAPEFLEEERRQLPDQFFRQEYLCEFVSADFAYFDPEAIDRAFAPGQEC
jgi:Terminase large subunit, T4likevirus-type, N-terminal